MVSVMLLMLLGVPAAVGQTMKASEAMNATTPELFRSAFLQQSMGIEKQFVSLVEAMPQDKFTWRPMEGVRSVAESFLHVATGNHIIVQMMGGKLPEGLNLMTHEKSTTDKSKIVDIIKDSFRAINEVVKNTSDADLAKPADFFGNKTTYLGLILLCATHEHETLGQAIAYARMNNVVPPWTAERQEKMKEKRGSKM